jgi:hypothetical protein
MLKQIQHDGVWRVGRRGFNDPRHASAGWHLDAETPAFAGVTINRVVMPAQAGISAPDPSLRWGDDQQRRHASAGWHLGAGPQPSLG